MSVQEPQAPTGGEYGARQQLMSAQQQQPIAGAPGPGPGGGMPGMGPGEIPGLEDPSAAPDEAVQAGLPSGPGGGQELLQSASVDPDIAVLKQIYIKFPFQGLARLIEYAEMQSEQGFVRPPDPYATENFARPPIPHDLGGGVEDVVGEDEALPDGTLPPDPAEMAMLQQMPGDVPPDMAGEIPPML